MIETGKGGGAKRSIPEFFIFSLCLLVSSSNNINKELNAQVLRSGLRKDNFSAFNNASQKILYEDLTVDETCEYKEVKREDRYKYGGQI